MVKSTILVVEDNPVNSAMLRLVLQKQNHAVCCVESGKACLEMVKTQPVDLVLMDIELPEMSGDEALKHIRAAESSICTLPVVAMTAHDLPDKLEQLATMGFDAVLSKPLDLTNLMHTIDKLLCHNKAQH